MTYTLEEFLKSRFPIMVLDCESIGLHGEVFAFGYTVIMTDIVVARARFSCPPEAAQGTAEDRLWVGEHVPSFKHTCTNPRALRLRFWEAWTNWNKNHNALLAADVAWPVEANFISACVQDDPVNRNWAGPYPLLDISGILFAAGINPLETQPRLQEELPEHDPLMDSAQSARLLIEAVKKLTATKAC